MKRGEKTRGENEGDPSRARQAKTAPAEARKVSSQLSSIGCETRSLTIHLLLRSQPFLKPYHPSVAFHPRQLLFDELEQDLLHSPLVDLIDHGVYEIAALDLVYERPPERVTSGGERIRDEAKSVLDAFELVEVSKMYEEVVKVWRSGRGRVDEVLGEYGVGEEQKLS